MRSEVQKLADEVSRKRREGRTENFDKALEFLDAAEKALDLTEYKNAEKKIEKAKQVLENK